MRLLFASCHCYIDPSSGAAVSARQLLELLATRGHDCRVLSAGMLDYQEEIPLDAVLAPLGCPYRRARTVLESGEADVYDLELDNVRIALLPTKFSRYPRALDPTESSIFLEMAAQIFDRFKPEVVLTYGGHPANLAMISMAKSAGIPVVFFLRNLAYHNPLPFAETSGILVASEFVRRVYFERLGLECTVIPSPLRTDRIVADTSDPRYLTFVNPMPEKGVTVFARIAAELDKRRPDIPLLVVESRSKAATLANAGLDLSGLKNLYMMENTHDPRDFYKVSRIILMPSLWEEPFGRVAAEGLANGLPVLASNRGGLPEVLGNAGFILPLPDRCTPTSGIVPDAEEVGPWIDAIERIWDDWEFESHQKAVARKRAERWNPDRIGEEYEDFFKTLLINFATSCGKTCLT